MSDTGTPPVIPVEFQQYNSYAQDPLWQRKFSIIWPSVLAFFVLLSLPRLIRAVRTGRAFSGVLFGVTEDLGYQAVLTLGNQNHKRVWRDVGGRRWRRVEGVLSAVGAVIYWTPPGIELNAGQLILLGGYFATVVLCMTLNVPLMSNSNRPGFIALAQLPPLFLLACKNTPLSLLLPGHGYEKLNFLHRWAGRVMFLGAVLHGGLWIRNHLQYGLPILGQQKEGSGVAALGLLGAIVLTSLGMVRKWCYEVFFVLHIVTFVGFFITLCYHTIYAAPWIFPPLAFYGLDLVLRMLRVRIKDALLVPVDSQMTLIHIPHCTTGWTAGQHVRLRVFFAGRVLESHPLTILSAPPAISCLAPSATATGIVLGARVSGDWTQALNMYALNATAENNTNYGDGKEKEKVQVGASVQVMLDGPYGGCGLDLGTYESVLLFAGGSGATFTLGLLDDIVGRCVRAGRKHGERTRRIEFAWCVRSFASIEWFTSFLMAIATTAASSRPSSDPLRSSCNEGANPSLDVHISIYVTCLCNPEAIPPIPNCDVTIVRPSIYSVLCDLMTPPGDVPAHTNQFVKVKAKGRAKEPQEKEIDTDADTIELDLDPEGGTLHLTASGRLPWVGGGGGVAVCAAGPAGLAREVANAVARVQLSGRGMRMGSMGLHTEVFAL